MDRFYSVLRCERCKIQFDLDIRRVQSWFTGEIICSDKCLKVEKKVLTLLGSRKFEYEDCGFYQIYLMIVYLKI